MTARVGHNGGPALDEPADTRPGRCKHCRHWNAPSRSSAPTSCSTSACRAAASGGRQAPATAS